MLRTVELSRAQKTRGIAITYRAGSGDMFGTCPASCDLNPTKTGTQQVDVEYLDALLDAVPRRGQSFTYSHFDPFVHGWGRKLREGKTVINYSTESVPVAAASIVNGVPAVAVVPAEFWEGRRHKRAGWGVRVVRCPAEYLPHVGCRECGSGRPLCARLRRNFVIGFTAHGVHKKKALDEKNRGGCYGSAGKVALHWRALAEQAQGEETDAERVKRFAQGLPPGAIVRHHVAGDIGKEA